MKRTSTILLLLAFALPTRAEQQPMTTKEHTLTPIDSMPTKDEIIAALPTNTASQLAAIAQDSTADFGMRLRAIRALPQFCAANCAGTTPHATLISLLDQHTPSTTKGKPVLLLRAAIEAFGVTRSGDPNDVSRLVPYLESTSRDIRAATAFALRDLCDPDAIAFLRNRYNVEMGPTGVPQVRLAISAALRDLGTCGS